MDAAQRTIIGRSAAGKVNERCLVCLSLAPQRFKAVFKTAQLGGMTEVARASVLTSEALFRALHPSSPPHFDTIARVCSALGGVWWRS